MQTEPLWLPKGSVRSLLAIAVTIYTSAAHWASKISTEQYLLFVAGILVAYGAYRVAAKK